MYIVRNEVTAAEVLGHLLLLFTLDLEVEKNLKSVTEKFERRAEVEEVLEPIVLNNKV